MSQLCPREKQKSEKKRKKQNKTNANVIVIIGNDKGRRAQPRADGARETAGA
jgi:hypothetical protein